MTNPAGHRPSSPSLIRLPHTGLWVPGDQLIVTSYKPLPTTRGVAYTATLKAGRRIVGTIENHGDGSGPIFRSRYPRHDPRTLTEQALDDYAALSQTQCGAPVNVDDLLDHLVSEFEWAQKVKKQAARQHAQLRMMGFILAGDDTPRGEAFPQGEATWAMPAERLNLAWAADTLSRKMPPGPHSWWQVWSGGRWIDVTARPAGIAADLCC